MSVERRPSKALSEIERSVARLLRRKVYVGVPASSRSSDGKVSNAVIAYVQERGDDELHIPARPFLEPGVRNAGPKVAKLLEQAAQAAIRGDQAAVDRAMEAVGLACQASVKTQMVTGPYPPLAPSTIYNRQHRSGQRTMSTTPLLDTRSLFNSITYVIGDE